MKELKTLLIALISSGVVFALAGQAGATLKDPILEARSQRLYHPYAVVLTQDAPPPPSGDSGSQSGVIMTPPQPPQGDSTDGSQCLQGEDYHGTPPSGGVCSQGWIPETVNGQLQCAPTQAKCDETAPGSVLTKDHSGFWVCWQKCPSQTQGQGGTGGMQGGQGQQGGQQGGSQGGPNQGQGFNPGSGVNGNGPGGGQGGGNFQFNRNSQQGQGGPGGMSDEQQQKFQQQQDEQQLKQIKRGLAQMSRGITPMTKQIAKLESQGVTISSDLKDAITKMTDLLVVVKNAKTMDEILAAGFENMQDWMQTINDGQQTLQLASRWQQTQKQVASELKKINKLLTRDQALAAKSKIDLSGAIATFQTAITDLQNSSVAAADLAKSGDIEGAYSELQDNFFDKIQDAYQNDQVIQTLLHLSKFDKDFQRQLSQMKKIVANLKKKKIDTTEMEGLLSQISDKGGEIKSLISAQPFDQDATESAMNDLQDLTQQLQGLIDDATGQQTAMPWEQGGQQFKSVQMPQNIGSMFTPMNQGQNFGDNSGQGQDFGPGQGPGFGPGPGQGQQGPGQGQ